MAERSTHIVVGKYVSSEEFSGNVSEVTFKIEEVFKGQCEELIYVYDDVQDMKLKENKSYLMFLEGTDRQTSPDRTSVVYVKRVNLSVRLAALQLCHTK